MACLRLGAEKGVAIFFDSHPGVEKKKKRGRRERR